MVAKPSKIGKYDVIDVLGRGGMGVVYKATDPHLNRMVAIKMMTGGFSDNPDLLKRFYREAQSTGNLQHPNIVTVYDLGDFEGNPYLVMEYLEGETLDALIHSRSALSLLTKINFVCEVCHGLAYAHHHGIVHRDIKPGNIMVLKNGGVKIVDFGIAHIGDKTVTRTGQLIGSLGYMSPEQVHGKPIDTRTDIFSTGVVLYQLLTYTLPFDGDSTASTLLKIIHDPPPPLDKFMSDIPPDLENAILRALAKDREERYRTVEDLGFDLAQIRDRLKEGLVEGYLREAETLLSGGFTYKAKDLLLQILKIDRQHTGATRLFRTVQQSIEQEQIGVQIKQLRTQAEEAFATQQFDAALGYVDKALYLHQTEPGLQSLKATIRKAKSQAEELQSLLHRAEAAHQEGDLDGAKRVLEETLEIAPNDLQAKTLFRVIHREWEERERRSQVDNLVGSARKEIASRRFTAALHVLKEAEALDPNAPEVKSLIESATAGREQEHHRKELEAINQKIDEALDRDDFITAGRTIDEGLLKFPDDRALLKLKSLTEKQRQVSERKQFIDEQLAQARSLIQAGRNEEVLQLLDAALQKVPNDPHLQSLQVIVRETVERERTEKRKSDLLQRAKECLRRKEFSEAISTLDAATKEFQNDADVADLLQFAKEEAAVDERRKATEAVLEKARALIENDEYEQAVQLLESDLSHEHEEEMGIALAQARNAAAEFHKRLEASLSTAKRLLQSRKAVEAVKLLESQPNSFRRNPVYDELFQHARKDAERWQNIEHAIDQSRELAGQGNFDQAFQVLEECKRLGEDSPELRNAAAEVEEHRSADATTKLELVMADGRMLMMAKEYRAVVDRLKPATDLSLVASAKLRGEFEALQSQAAAALVRQRKAQIEQLLRKGEHLEAAELLRGSQTEFPDNRSLSDLKKKLDDAVGRRTEVQSLLNTARRLFGESSWEQGGEACVRAISLAVQDPWLREQAIEAAVRAANSAVENDWRSAETLVNGLTEVRAGTAVPASLRSRIADKKREQAIQEVLSDARGLETSGDFSGALEAIKEGLVSFPEDATLTGLRNEIQQRLRDKEEEARVERERELRRERLDAIAGQLEREPLRASRMRILEDAVREYPDEAPLQKQLADLVELTRGLDQKASRAKTLEGSKKYSDAIDVWEEIKVLDSYFPAMQSSLDRLQGLQQQEQAARKASLATGVESAISAYDFERTSALLLQAQTEFPSDPVFARLEKSRDQQAALRAGALQLVAESHNYFEQKNWDKGAASVQKATESNQADPVVRQRAMSELLQSAESALLQDWQAAENLINRAAVLNPPAADLSRLQASLERRKREARVTQHLVSVQKLESAGDWKGALQQLALGLREYPDEPQLLQRKQVLETRLRDAEAAAEREKRITEHQASAQKLSSAGDLQGSLNLVKRGLAEFPGEARLLKMKAAIEKSIGEAEEATRREQQRKRQEEEQQRRQEQKAAREEEKRKKEEAAEQLRLERTRQRDEEARKKAEARQLREREVLARRLSVGPEVQRAQESPAWKLPAALAIGVVFLGLVWGGVHYLSTRHQQSATAPTAPASTSVAPQINPLELQQRAALKQADESRVAGDLPKALRELQDGAALNGPLTGEIQKMQDAVQAEMKDEGLRKLRQQEAGWWEEATNDVDHGQFRNAEKYFSNILALPQGGIRRDDAKKYIREIIPQRVREETLLTQAKRASQKNDQASLSSAAGLLDQVIALGGPRKSEAEELKRQVGDKLSNLQTQQQQKQTGQQLADLQAGAQRDMGQGDLASARHKVDQIRQAGGDSKALEAGIRDAEKLEQARQQSETDYQQTVQKYQQYAAANDAKGLESLRASFQSVAQSGSAHASEARGYVSEINTKLAALNQPAPAAKPDVPPLKTAVNEDDAVRGIITKYGQALEQRNVDAMQAIWPSLGKKRYERYKRNFETATAMHVQSQIEFRIEGLDISQDRQSATVRAVQLQTNTLQGKAPESRQDKATFQLTRANGGWVITDVQ